MSVETFSPPIDRGVMPQKESGTSEFDQIFQNQAEQILSTANTKLESTENPWTQEVLEKTLKVFLPVHHQVGAVEIYARLVEETDKYGKGAVSIHLDGIITGPFNSKSSSMGAHYFELRKAGILQESSPHGVWPDFAYGSKDELREGLEDARTWEGSNGTKHKPLNEPIKIFPLE